MDFQEQISAKTDQELLNIYINSGDYQEAFANQTHQELIKRGVSLEEYKAEKENKMFLATELLREGKKGNELYIVLGFISSVLGGFIGIIAGYVYSQSKQPSPSGEQYYVYDKQTRDKGRVMMIIGLFAFLLTIIWRLS